MSLNLIDPLLSIMEEPQEEPGERFRRETDVDLIHPHPDCLAEILIEYPWLQHLYEEYRVLLDPDTRPDRLRAQLDVLRHAERTYEQSTGDKAGALAAAAPRPLYEKPGADQP